ncbi:MAG: beta strand repeat-containing protein, partial [Saprospiraceae bacterium]
MIKCYPRPFKKAFEFQRWRRIIGCIILCLSCIIPTATNAQVCGCTNCPGVVAPVSTVDFTFEVQGANNDDLANATQAVCGVLLDIKPEHFWSTQFSLISPSGQTVRLIGPPRLDLLIGYSAVGPWNIAFVPCSDAVNPDPLFPDTWDNDAFDFGIVGGSYTGSYYPFMGCLEDFNTGTVNGLWTLRVQNVSGFYEAEVDYFEVLFCDDSGLDCNPCEADAGVIGNNLIIDACVNDTILKLDLPPSYGSTAPDTNLYGYTYLISFNGIIEEYNAAPDLRGWNAGTYLVCGLSYSYADTLKIPQPNGSLTRIDLEDALQNINPIFCGDITDDCVLINIQPPDTLTINGVFCAGDTYLYQGVSYDTTGVFTFEIASTNGCDSTIILSLTEIPATTTTIDTMICSGDVIGVGAQIYTMSGSYSDTLVSAQNCDSIVYLNLQVKDSIITYLEKAICIGDSCVIGTIAHYSSGIFMQRFTAADGCDSMVVLDLEVLTPDVFIAAPELLSCTNSPITLDGSGSSTGSSIVYEWTHLDNGGDGIVSGENTSLAQVNKLGEYQLSVTDTLRGAFCRIVNTVNVFGDLNVPNLNASADSITCGNSQANLTGFSLTSNVNYTWLGPSGVYAIQKDTITELPGLYTLIVTAPNGCQDSMIVEVQENTQTPIAQITGDTLDCNQTQVVLDGNGSSGSGLSYEWETAGGTFINNTNTISVVTSGNYNLIVENANNACRDTASFNVVENLLVPTDIIVTADTLTCSKVIATLTGNTTSVGAQFQWNGPASFVAHQKDTFTNIPGLYTLTVTGINGCTASENLVVILDNTLPTVTTNAEMITCAQSTVALTATTTDSDLIFRWTGPAAFEAFTKDTFTNVPGLYQLTVTAPNACTVTVDQMVSIDVDLPNASAMADTLTCNQSTAMLQGNSTTDNVSYAWSGPAGFTSQMQDTITDIPGIYQLTVTSENACTAMTEVTVILEEEEPTITASADTINCTMLVANLNGNSTTENTSFLWSGPAGFTANVKDTSTTIPGTYQLVVTGDNGCTNTFDLEVLLDETIPTITAAVGSISCTATSANLSGSSTTANVSYEWQGPAGYQSNQADTSTTIPGTYQFIVTASNTCTAEMELEVIADQDLPTVSATADTITCTAPIANLMSSSTSNNLSYLWTGPLGFSAVSPDTLTNVAGLYTLMVNAVNGCSASTQVTVVANNLIPDLVLTADTLNCTEIEATLSSNSSVVNLIYSWTGPSGFNASQADTTTSIAGNYQLLVTAPNGCATSEAITVISDESIPAIAISADSLSCTSATAGLYGSSTTENVTYQWTGPNGFFATQADTSTTVGGIYELQITGANTCVATETVTVFQDQSLPTITAIAEDLNCLQNTASLAVNTTTTGMTYFWTGPNGFTAYQSDTITDASGFYEVTATATNGCSVTAQVAVESDVQNPSFSIAADTITCFNPISNLSSESIVVYENYQWEGPAGFSAQAADTITNIGGTYLLTVTGVNGCSATQSIEVVADTIKPNIIATADTINCSQTTANLVGNATTDGVSFQWSSVAGFSSQMKDTVTTLAGVYQLLVTAANGCSATEEVLVIEDIVLPTVLAMVDTITCVNETAALTGNSTTPNVSYTWTGPNGFFSEAKDTSTTLVGVYTLTVTSENACTASEIVTVTTSQDLPTISASASAISCTVPIADLLGNSTTPNVNYEWSGPGGFMATSQDTSTSVPGWYELKVIALNGCEVTMMVEVISDQGVPDIEIMADTITCTTASATLTGNSTTTNVTYVWTGPAGFNALQKDTSTTIPGIYQLVVTAANNCSTVGQVEVVSNTESPAIDLQVDTLNCENSIANLSATTIIPAVQFEWTGPMGFIASVQDTSTTVAGTYSLVVTNANGCSTTTAVEIIEDLAIPTITANVDTITCISNKANLTGTSSTVGVSYLWTGPAGFAANVADTSTMIVGTYQFTVTGENGCSQFIEVEVIADQDTPELTGAVGEISCTNAVANLTANSTTEDVTYLWTGPNNFMATVADTSTSIAGIYEITVTGANACQNSLIFEVIADQNIPTVTATADTITCILIEANLFGTSNQSDVTYLWTGPNGFLATSADTSTTVAGLYQLVVTAANDCSATVEVEVISNQSLPNLSATTDSITCLQNFATLSGSSTDDNLNYTWTGPNGFIATVADTTTTIAGTYNLTATALNGCESNVNVVVTEDTAVPELLNASISIIDCNQSVANLTASSTTLGVSYTWLGPNGFMASVADTVSNLVGEYQLVLTAPNSCTSTTMLNLIEDITPPIISGMVDSITCEQTFANLSASATTMVASYQWQGPNGYLAGIADTTTTLAGDYELTVTGTNGCTTTTSFEVTASVDIPTITATADTISCSQISANLQGSTTTPNTTYQWIGPNSFNENDLMTSTTVPGNYQLVITSANACSASATVTVIADTLAPIATANISGNLDCTQILALLDGNGFANGAALVYEWQNEAGIFLTEDTMLEVSENGQYQFIVTNLENDCVDTAWVELDIDLLDLAQTPITNDDVYEMTNLTSLDLSMLDNDQLDAVEDWELTILNSPMVGSLTETTSGNYT